MVQRQRRCMTRYVTRVTRLLPALILLLLLLHVRLPSPAPSLALPPSPPAEYARQSLDDLLSTVANQFQVVNRTRRLHSDAHRIVCRHKGCI